MSPAKLVAVGGLAVMSLAACGTQTKPLAGSSNVLNRPGIHAKLDDPRVKHAQCIEQHGLAVHDFTGRSGYPSFTVGGGSGAPTVIFLSTPGGAQWAQIDGSAQSAEVIGAALVYPNQGSDSELSTIESCTAVGVSG